MLKPFARFIAFLLFLALNSPALAEDLESNVIRLSSTGEVKIQPNLATISVAVTTQAKTADSAVKDNAKRMEKVVKVLQSKIAKEDTLQTSQYQVSPVYSGGRDGTESQITGYRVSNQITIEFHHLAALGGLLDTLVDNGVNQIDTLRLGHTDMAALQKQALDQAITQGKATAEMIAKSAGVTLKGIKEITSFDNHPAPVFREMAMASGGNASQVLPGEITISASVNMVYGIQ